MCTEWIERVQTCELNLSNGRSYQEAPGNTREASSTQMPEAEPPAHPPNRKWDIRLNNVCLSPSTVLPKVPPS
jgi:hypothetical protein